MDSACVPDPAPQDHTRYVRIHYTRTRHALLGRALAMPGSLMVLPICVACKFNSLPNKEGSHASNAFKLRVLVSLVALESAPFFLGGGGVDVWCKLKKAPCGGPQRVPIEGPRCSLRNRI